MLYGWPYVLNSAQDEVSLNTLLDMASKMALIYGFF